MRHQLFVLLLGILAPCIATAQIADNKIFVGTSAFMLANLNQTGKPLRFYQLDIGYRLTTTDVVSLEAITWRYYGPIGATEDDTSFQATSRRAVRGLRISGFFMAVCIPPYTRCGSSRTTVTKRGV